MVTETDFANGKNSVVRAIENSENNNPEKKAARMETENLEETMAKLEYERFLLRSLLDNIPDTIYYKDANGKFLQVNKAQAKVLGLDDPDQAIGKSDFDFFTEEHARDAFADEQNIIKQGKPLLNKIEKIRTADGTFRWVTATKIPLRNNGDIGGIVGISRDITDIVAIEAALEEKNKELAFEKKLLTSLMDHVPDSIYFKDTQSRFIRINKALAALLGIENPNEALGKTDFDFFANEHAADAFSDEQKLIQTGIPLINKIEQDILPNGFRRWVSSTKMPIHDEDGNSLGLVGISRDISDIQNAQVELAQKNDELAFEKNLLSSLLDNIPDSIYFKDTQSRFIRINKALAILLGLENPDEAIGKTDFDFFAQEHAADAFNDEKKLMQTGVPLINKLEEDILPNGFRRWISSTKMPIYDSKGNVLGLVGISRDVTEIKMAQIELARKNDELDIALVKSQAATKAKSEFLANMSHEIRTPMNAVIGMTGLLLDTDLTEEQREFVETVRTSGDALLTIINDILDFSKIEAGKLEMENQPFDLRGCVEESLDLHATSASKKGIDLAYIIDDNTPVTIVGDVTRLRQVLNNLLSNAIKFTKEGEVVVSVKSVEVRNNKHDILFNVQDTGIGIPESKLDKLFKSFSQVDASTTREYGGTGLGLAICKYLVQMMGGNISVASHAGKGSTFSFTINAESSPGNKLVYLQDDQPSLAGKRILIVDDNETNCRILNLQTQKWGMLTCTTVSGYEALEWIKQGEKFDAAILDMQMPIMDGITLGQEIRKLKDPQQLPLLMLTSVGWKDNTEQIEKIQFAKCMSKPIKQAQLYHALLSVFKGQITKAAPAEKSSPFDPTMGARIPLKILVAEDSVVNQKLAIRVLEKLGYRADVAANGIEAIEALARQGYDVILMDVQMPEMDGLKATEIIRERWPNEGRPRIIAMTATAMRGDKEKCIEAGMDDYISKPVRVEELIKALEASRTSAGAVQESY